jgi:hypothetical protein
VVSVDDAGYIREIKSTVTFASGASVDGDQTYSDFGCAGTVTPGSPVVQPAPAGCVSSDQSGAVPTSVDHHRHVDDPVDHDDVKLEGARG